MWGYGGIKEKAKLQDEEWGEGEPDRINLMDSVQNRQGPEVKTKQTKESVTFLEERQGHRASHCPHDIETGRYGESWLIGAESGNRCRNQGWGRNAWTVIDRLSVDKPES